MYNFKQELAKLSFVESLLARDPNNLQMLKERQNINWKIWCFSELFGIDYVTLLKMAISCN